MDLEFLKEFKNITKDEIVEFINKLTKATYGRKILMTDAVTKEHNFTFCYEEEAKGYGNFSIAFNYYYRTPDTTKRTAGDFILLKPFDTGVLHRGGDEFAPDEALLTKSWQQYLYRHCPHYIAAFTEFIKHRADVAASKVLEEGQEEIRSFSQNDR